TKDPGQLPGDYVECPDVAGRCEISLSRGAAEDNQVFKHPTGASCRQRPGGPVYASLEIQLATVCKGVHQFSGARINGIQKACGSNENAAVRAILTLPVVTTPLAGDPAEHAEAAGKLVSPEFFTSRGVECDKRTLFGRY